MADYKVIFKEYVENNPNLTIAAAVTVGLGVVGYIYVRNAHQYWQRRGIKGPKPTFLIGNVIDIMFGNRAEREKRWVKEFGEVYGVFQGRQPRLFVADPEVMLQICIKDFDSFVNHGVDDLTNKYQRSFLFALKDDHWKRVRALMSPTFTSGKIKRMFKFLDGCADDLVACVAENLEINDGIVDVRNLYNSFAMDAIATCCYGLKLGRSAANSGGKDEPGGSAREDFIKAAKTFSNINMARLLLYLTMPKFILRLFKFEMSPEYSLKGLVSIGTRIMENRRKSEKKFDDYLQLLLDAELDNKLELEDIDSEENHHASLSSDGLLRDQLKMVNDVNEKLMFASKRKVVLSDVEILAGSIFLLSVGLDTTSILLMNTTYILAFHQEIQDKLYQELMNISTPNVGARISFDYEPLTSCKYLDAVLSESLRLMAPIFSLDRVTNKDYYLEKYNLHIERGILIDLGFYAIMNNPKYWPEPEKFDPERFMPGNKEKIVPGSYCPFGIGPRHCIGMRFSLTESKLALAKLMTNYRIDPAPGASYPPEPKTKFVLNGIKDPLVKFSSRS